MIKQMFVAGGSGFIGTQFVPLAVAAGYQVQALSRSDKSGAALRQLGAIPIAGDLLVPGEWQKAAAQADVVVHLAQPATFGVARVTKARALVYERDRQIMDRHLIEALDPSHVQKVVYVSGTSYYGQQGQELRDESTIPNPRGWGPYIAAAIEQLKRYKNTYPIVEVFPGAVYGPSSWLGEALESMQAGKRLPGLRGRQKTNSAIHFEDCARAILHLAENGAVGERYFAVDSKPCTLADIATIAAQTLNIPLKSRLVPKALVALLVGQITADSLDYENCLSNAKLLGTGFKLNYPTVQQGVPDVVHQWLAMHHKND